MHEMTTLQAAYWVGRQSTTPRAGDAAHLYIEFEGQGIDETRLAAAVHTLFARHEMLRVTVSEDGQWSVGELNEFHALQVLDWRALDAADCDERLRVMREQKTHQKLALDQGQGAEFVLTRLSDDRFRLHVDVDMIAADAQSFRLMIEALVAAYHGELSDARSAPFAEFQHQMTTAAQQALAARDRRYWQALQSTVAPAPKLPERDPVNPDTAAVHTERLAFELSAPQRAQLEALAAQHHLSLSAVSLGAFNALLADALKQPAFRINVPLFYRPQGFDDTVGDFANLTLFSANCAPNVPLLTLFEQTQHQLMACLEHRHYSGVNVMRDLSRQQGSLQTSPVVFTSGWDIGGDLYSQRVHDTLGDMVWACSQGAHVLLDAQIVPYKRGVLINWDVRTDSVPREFYQSLFTRYVALLSELAERAERVLQPCTIKATSIETTSASSSAQRPHQTLLNGLQQAYLVGRSEHLPLGGVAMQDFRVYRGTVDADQLHARLVELVDTLPVLRTRIDDTTLTQWVSDDRIVNWQHHDLRDVSRAQALCQAEALIEQVSHSRHDLSRSPWKIWLVSLPEAEPDTLAADAFRHIVLTSFDALISDGHSIAYLLARLLENHPKPVAAPLAWGAMSEVPAKPLSQQSTTQQHITPKQKANAREMAQAYWREKLASVTEPMALPWQAPLHTLYQPRYARESVTLSRDETRALLKQAASERLFPNSVLTTLVMHTLANWCPGTPLCIGLPVAPPPQAGELTNRSSFIALTYALDEADFATQARRVQRYVAEGMAHLAFSGIELNRQLMSQLPARTLPLPVVITNGLGWETLRADNTLQQHDGLTQTPQIALDIRLAYDAHKNLVISADYVTQALSQAQVAAWLTSCKRAALSMIERQSLQWVSREALDLSHYHRNTEDSDDGTAPFLTTLAERLWDMPSQRTALFCGEQRWTYQQLGEQVANMMAHLQARGVKAGDVVAICLPRSAAHVIATLSCALSGVIWVPIDAASPPERKTYLLSHCQPALVIVASDDVENVEHPHCVAMRELLQPALKAARLPSQEVLRARSHSEAPAYYLYTSGTTGQPKCVVLNNRATANVLHHTLAAWQVNERDVMLSVTPLHHDMSVFDLLGSLCAGAALVIPEPEAEKDALHWNTLVERHGVTLWCSVPAILEMLLTCQSISQGQSLRLIAQGGDYIKPQTIQTLRERLPNARLFSLGGPTETTIWSIWHELEPEDGAVIPYGAPLPGTQYYVVNEQHQHCPQGVVGRIVTAGMNLSLGYLVDGEVVQTDFIAIETSHGERVRAFKTGDLGYYRDDGRLIFAGRINGYVKVRGVRISLPDVEKVLMNVANVQDLAVIDFNDPITGDVGLALFYISGDGAVKNAAQWRDIMGQRLPASHLPQRFVPLDRFPLSANGKKDKRALLAMLTAANESPRTVAANVAAPLESSRESQTTSLTPEKTVPWQSIVDVYQQVLGERAASLTEHAEFIQAGLMPSHVKAVAEKLSQTFGKSVQPRQLLSCKNAGQVSKLLELS
ncbi:amino acid adenylation domain-containing protein [Vibrio fluvialis]|uniref:amino acid adenylation domain-containing protein n=1 Tax=Vibrio fluvialis TaxID=676 RepID=UPI001BAFCDBB|nr:amino acid adenylation domain-containing protein [Vibrio fluvialis]EKO3498697.1 amino acid adenylation domain-containing protein [Vibrio fluvialis]EKO3968339.1 amino acid adenylation domain-containing protein [Vibrio fluvialis]EKZ8999759.1 amino acid adenylation domain-containing protein [Vibrio fluvialis]ELI1828538.1 amino acid adenylation domain-containing protein [Vibrio fluvialis]QUF67725.1 amino acid adenylation domain-containing protein [Vibrio fluvialis]